MKTAFISAALLLFTLQSALAGPSMAVRAESTLAKNKPTGDYALLAAETTDEAVRKWSLLVRQRFQIEERERLAKQGQQKPLLPSSAQWWLMPPDLKKLMLASLPVVVRADQLPKPPPQTEIKRYDRPSNIRWPDPTTMNHHTCYIFPCEHPL